MGVRGVKSSPNVIERRELRLIRGRTQLFWEITRRRTEVRSRSWGPRRKEYVTVRTFRSPERAASEYARQVESQLARGVRDEGSPTPQGYRGAWE